MQITSTVESCSIPSPDTPPVSLSDGQSTPLTFLSHLANGQSMTLGLCTRSCALDTTHLFPLQTIHPRAPCPRLLGGGGMTHVPLCVTIGKAGHLHIDLCHRFLVGVDPLHLTIVPCHGASHVRHLISLVRTGTGTGPLRHLERDLFLLHVVVTGMLTIIPCHGASHVRHLIALVRTGTGTGPLRHLERDLFLPHVVVTGMLTIIPCHGASHVRHLIALVRTGTGTGPLRHLERDLFLPHVVVTGMYRACLHLVNIHPHRRVAAVPCVHQGADHPWTSRALVPHLPETRPGDLHLSVWDQI